MKLDLTKLDIPDARLVQYGLNALGYLNLPNPQGLPAAKTIAAHDAYWEQVGKVADAVVDENPKPGSVDIFRATLARIALSQVGVREEGGNNRGRQIDVYEGATWLDPSGDYAWCASFICWVFREALKATGYAPEWARPRTPGAYALRDEWATANAKRGIKVMGPNVVILPGDIIVFTFSHVALSTAISKIGEGDVRTVEGNTNTGGTRDGGGRVIDGVFAVKRPRHLIANVLRVRAV